MLKLILKTQHYVIIFYFLSMCSNIYAQDANAHLKSLLTMAKNNNLQIQIAFNQWKIEEHKIKIMRSLEDPIISYSYIGEAVQTKVGPQRKRYNISQKIPFPGKLKLKEKSQFQRSQIFKERYKSIENEIIKQVKHIYYDLYFMDQSLVVYEEEISILKRVEDVIQRKYESNMVPQQDVIKIQVQFSEIIRKIFLLKQLRQSLNIKLNTVLNRKHTIIFPNITTVNKQEFEYSLTNILNTTMDNRQELLIANLSIKDAEYKKSLAKMAFFPNFTIGAEYIEIENDTIYVKDSGQDAWIGKISVNIPIWFQKIKSQIQEKEYELKKAHNVQSNLKNVVIFEVKDMYSKISTYKKILLLYQTSLIPKAQQFFDISQTGFETGSISFLDWLDTQRTYLRTRLAYHQTMRDYHKSIASLENFVGEKLGGYNE